MPQLAEQFLPKAQCGFRAGRGKSMISALIFVDITKAFDTVNQTTMWKFLRKLGCSDQFTTLILSLHTGMKASVILEVTNGVKHGCVLAPTLFSIYLTMVMNTVFDSYDNGVWI